jgi:uncharacterized protein with PIN domain
MNEELCPTCQAPLIEGWSTEPEEHHLGHRFWACPPCGRTYIHDDDVTS